MINGTQGVNPLNMLENDVKKQGTQKITKKLLDSYRKIKREIPILEMELQQMVQTESGLGNDTIFDYRKGYPQPQSIIGFDQERYDRRWKILQGKKDKVNAVEQWIDAIEDGQTRYVFRMYYQDGMTWTKIAQKIGYSRNPDYPRLYIRDNFLRKNNIK